MSESRLKELQAQLQQISAELAEIQGATMTAAKLFPGRWRKSWQGETEGSEEFTVEGNKLRVLKTTNGIKTSYRLELTSKEDGALQLRQAHRSSQPCFPKCEITIKRAGNGYVGTELANGKTNRVRYEPVTA